MNLGITSFLKEDGYLFVIKRYVWVMCIIVVSPSLSEFWIVGQSFNEIAGEIVRRKIIYFKGYSSYAFKYIYINMYTITHTNHSIQGVQTDFFLPVCSKPWCSVVCFFFFKNQIPIFIQQHSCLQNLPRKWRSQGPFTRLQKCSNPVSSICQNTWTKRRKISIPVLNSFHC